MATVPEAQRQVKPGEFVGCYKYPGKACTVRFVGPVAFASGIWVGIELQTPDGKHDGTVAGMRYFECEKKHGVFVRETDVFPILENSPMHIAPEANPPGAHLENGHHRHHSISAGSVPEGEHPTRHGNRRSMTLSRDEAAAIFKDSGAPEEKAMKRRSVTLGAKDVQASIAEQEAAAHAQGQGGRKASDPENNVTGTPARRGSRRNSMESMSNSAPLLAVPGERRSLRIGAGQTLVFDQESSVNAALAGTPTAANNGGSLSTIAESGHKRKGSTASTGSRGRPDNVPSLNLAAVTVPAPAPAVLVPEGTPAKDDTRTPGPRAVTFAAGSPINEDEGEGEEFYSDEEEDYGYYSTEDEPRPVPQAAYLHRARFMSGGAYDYMTPEQARETWLREWNKTRESALLAVELARAQIVTAQKKGDFEKVRELERELPTLLKNIPKSPKELWGVLKAHVLKRKKKLVRSDEAAGVGDGEKRPAKKGGPNAAALMIDDPDKEGTSLASLAHHLLKDDDEVIFFEGPGAGMFNCNQYKIGTNTVEAILWGCCEEKRESMETSSILEVALFQNCLQRNTGSGIIRITSQDATTPILDIKIKRVVPVFHALRKFVVMMQKDKTAIAKGEKKGLNKNSIIMRNKNVLSALDAYEDHPSESESDDSREIYEGEYMHCWYGRGCCPCCVERCKACQPRSRYRITETHTTAVTWNCCFSTTRIIHTSWIYDSSLKLDCWTRCKCWSHSTMTLYSFDEINPVITIMLRDGGPELYQLMAQEIHIHNAAAAAFQRARLHKAVATAHSGVVW